MATRKRSVVWSFFEDDLSSKRAICLICAENILHCGNTTNMLKHLRSKHQDELSDAAKRKRTDNMSRAKARHPTTEQAQDDGIENDAEMDVFETEDQPTEQERLMGHEETGRPISDDNDGSYILTVKKNKKRSAVWRYYQDGLDPHKVLCLVCSENINYPQNTSNLLRHLRKKHPGEYADIEGKVKERSGEGTRAMVSRSLAEQTPHNGVAESNPVIQVCITGESEEQEHNEDTGMAIADIADEAYALSVIPNKRRSAVWSYYQRGEDSNRVLCLLCSENIQYRQNTSNLLRHLRKRHPDKYTDGESKAKKVGSEDAMGAVVYHNFNRPTLINKSGSTNARMHPDMLEVFTVEQAGQMRRTLEQETRALERERELTEQLRRAQQQEARALEQQRELTEQLRRAQEEEMRRVRQLETRALEQERQAVEQLRKAQEQESRAIEREREVLEQLRRELEEDRKAVQRQWDAIGRSRAKMVEQEAKALEIATVSGVCDPRMSI
ncbi:hypothetical protein AAFF_G00227550 [Aldrovandia affinis]|uniref:BED-type domain-containing protein n=1 Tax=Aldrovandia affinis TaxID=143900 RepID=A0AAD7X2D0_9TELE|nr:hypothetical protein AAFF_G00227550 [Aldrovandia affinis]